MTTTLAKPSTESRRRELLVPGRPDALSAIRWVVCQMARSAGLAEGEVHQIELAVDEACANIVEHNYRHLDPKPHLHLAFDTDEELFAVSIYDRGHAFDLSAVQPHRFPQHYIEGNERGAGLYIIHSCADAISYERLPDERNHVRIVKRIKRTDAAAPA